MLTLKELVNRCLNKDKAAWAEFAVRFRPLVERAVRLRLTRHSFSYTSEDIKDISQGIFLELWEHNKLSQVKDEEKITGWLVIVSQNAAIDFIRSQAKFNRQRNVFLDSEGQQAPIIDCLPSPSNLFEEISKDELQKTIDSLVERLEPKEKLMLRLSLQHNLTHREIAGFMKMPINTVSSILRRTMLCFRESLKKKGYSDSEVW